MGPLQQRLSGDRCGDIVCATNHKKLLPYDIWVKQVSSSCAGKSGPVTTVSVGTEECDRILSNLGVVKRGYRSIQNSDGSDNYLSSGNDGTMDGDFQNQKIKRVRPRDLTIERLQQLIDQKVDYKKIMEKYNFTSERFFRLKLKEFGYRLYQGKIWVIKDKLWLKCHAKRDGSSCC